MDERTISELGPRVASWLALENTVPALWMWTMAETLKWRPV